MASNYEKLVKALRCCGSTSADCTVCPWDKYTFGMCAEKLLMDAVAAIEELQADVEEQKQIAAHYEQSAKDWWAEACDYYAIASARDIPAEESEELIKKFKKLPVGPIEPIKIKPIKPHWVSVEDPPKDKQECFVAFKGPLGFVYDTGRFYDDLNSGLDEDIFEDGTSGFVLGGEVGYALESIDYWMPIEPPQEVQE